MNRDTTEDDVAQWHQDLTMAMVEGTGLREDLASRIAGLTLQRLQERRGGRTCYLPVVSKQDRNEAIRRAFNGTNHAEICETYGVSRTTLYRVLPK